jgi:hypothetical protein
MEMMPMISAPTFKLSTEIVKNRPRNTIHAGEFLTLVGWWIAQRPFTAVRCVFQNEMVGDAA